MKSTSIRKIAIAQAVLAVFLAASLVSVPSSTAQIQPLRPASIVVVKNPHWSGYAQVAANGSVTMIETSFKVPETTCNSSSIEEQEMYFFASMDDLVTSNDFEYAGVLSYCPQGSTTPYYYAINTPDFVISGWTPSAGDLIYANITVIQGEFYYNVTDVTTGQSTQAESSASGTTLNSGQVLTDTGNCGNSTVTVDCPLSDFGTVSFGQNYTAIRNTNFVTINGHTKAIGKIETGSTLYKGITTNDAGTKVDATTSSLTSGKSSFVVTFKASGP